LMTHLTTVATSTVTWLFYGLSILILAFYFLLDGARMSKDIVSVFPDSLRTRMHAFVIDADRSLHSFFKGQIVLGLLFGAFMVAVYSALGVPYALALGIILGVWEVVPVIGPTVGFIPTIIAVLVQGMDHVPANRFIQVLIVLTVFSICQWLKDNIVAPRYIGNVIGLHPVVIFIAIMIGARVDGMLGIIVALPVACIINVFFKHMRSTEQEETVPIAEGMSPGIAVQVSSYDRTKRRVEPSSNAIIPVVNPAGTHATSSASLGSLGANPGTSSAVDVSSSSGVNSTSGVSSASVDASSDPV